MSLGYYKGSFLFLDWCPAPNGVSNISYGRHDPERKVEILKAVKEKLESDTETLIQSINFQRREDGIFAFFINFRQGVDLPDIYDVSRRASLLLKSRCFEHRHTHHPDENVIIGNHYPVLCDSRGIKQFSDDFLENSEKIFNDMTDEERNEKLKQTVHTTDHLLRIRKIGQSFSKSQQFAAIELKHYLSDKHDNTISKIDSFKTSFRRKRFSAIIEASIISILVFALLEALSNSSFSISSLTKSFIGGAIVFASFIYMRLLLAKTSVILKSLNEAIGFLHRSSTYCARVSMLYERANGTEFSEKLCYGPDRGFAGYVGSLEELKDRHKSALERRLVVIGIAMATGALVATLAAL